MKSWWLFWFRPDWSGLLTVGPSVDEWLLFYAEEEIKRSGPVFRPDKVFPLPPARGLHQKRRR